MHGNLRSVSIHYEPLTRNVDFGLSLVALFHQQPNLESIRITHTPLLSNVVGSLAQCRRLRSLAIAANFQNQASELQFLNILVGSCPDLEVLSLRFLLDIRQPHNPHIPCPTSLIQPLLGLHELVEARLQFDHAVISNTNTIFAMGAAWRRLQILCLACPVTLLPSIAAAFGTTLRRITANMTFDDGRLPPANQVMATFSQLQHLAVERSEVPLSRVIELAEFLAVCCPQATIIRFVETTGTETSFEAGSPWAMVVRMVNVIRHVREADRARLGNIQ